MCGRLLSLRLGLVEVTNIPCVVAGTRYVALRQTVHLCMCLPVIGSLGQYICILVFFLNHRVRGKPGVSTLRVRALAVFQIPRASPKHAVKLWTRDAPPRTPAPEWRSGLLSGCLLCLSQCFRRKRGSCVLLQLRSGGRRGGTWFQRKTLRAK